MKNANGYGGINKMSGKRRNPYRVVITTGWEIVDGHAIQKRKTLGYYPTQQKARIALDNYNMKPINLSAMTFQEVYERWWSDYKDTLSTSMVYQYTRAYKRASELYNKRMPELNTMYMENFIDDLKITDNEKNAMRTLLIKVFDEAIRYNVIEVNCARNIRVKKVIGKKIQVPFTDEEIEILWKRDEPVAKYTLCAIYSGFRANELLNIEIVTEDGIKCFKGGSKTKSGKNRLVPIHDKIIELSNYLIEEYNPTHDYEQTKRQFNRLMKALNTKHVIHDARSTFASKCDQYEVSPIIMKHLMGHQVEDITEKFYTRRNMQRYKEEIDKIQ